VTDLSAGENSFLAAREATKRGCIERYRKEHPELAPDAFLTLPLLLAPELRTLSWNVLTQARGPQICDNALFTATIWIEHQTLINGRPVLLKGAQATVGGIHFRRPLSDFVRLLHERTEIVSPKRMGWVIEPTTNIDGHRTNQSTTAMHALFLDCDGRGEWTTLLAGLADLNFCFVAYQSGGWTPTTPKWRVVLPLSAPFDTTTETLREAWKNAYHHARVVFGSIAYLSGEGFDSATDTPCCPWFLTEKRDPADPPRQIITRTTGHSLDLMSLIMALPAVEEETTVGSTRTRAETSNGFSDERLDEIIVALAQVTNHIPSGRHDLYLALPGVLLDRGMNADDVLAVVDGVSASYPRKHPDKHKDNIHNAKTTIGRWQDGHNVTRIGTLNERWPEIAQALDRVFPDPTEASLRAATTAMLEETTQPPITPSTTHGEAPTAKKKRRRLGDLGREVVPVIARLKEAKEPKKRATAVLLRRILDGEPFKTAEGVSGDAAKAQIDSCVNEAMLALGFNLPNATFVQVLDLAHLTLHSMDFTQSADRVAAAEQAFLKGQQQYRKWYKKKRAVDLAFAEQLNSALKK